MSGDWIDQVVEMVGQYVHIETLDGCHREGRLSSLHARTLILNDHPASVLTTLELNGDPYDIFQVDRIKNLSLVKI